ncbi:PREDICTED: uncharacterized protein LOC106808419, partial [Priapulus caudatus]|uniref:Uncharacterized protein LOC106808419 n=1 Tax=Priapulus caudatus TaxID=37621 RepID=A0ABM1E352_PRICU
TAYNNFTKNVSSPDKQLELSSHLSQMLRISLRMVSGGQHLQFTALVTINKIIDICIIHQVGHLKRDRGDGPQEGADVDRKCDTPSGSSSKWWRGPSPSTGNRNLRSSFKRKEKERSPVKEDVPKHSIDPSTLSDVLSPFEIISDIDPGLVLTIMHNAITLHKRVVGTRMYCTPSQRYVH